MSDFYERFDRIFRDADGRLRHRKIGEKTGIAGPFRDRRLWEPVSCANCGAAYGFVTKDTPFIGLCQKCYERHGHLPLPVVPGTEDV